MPVPFTLVLRSYLDPCASSHCISRRHLIASPTTYIPTAPMCFCLLYGSAPPPMPWLYTTYIHALWNTANPSLFPVLPWRFVSMRDAPVHALARFPSPTRSPAEPRPDRSRLCPSSHFITKCRTSIVDSSDPRRFGLASTSQAPNPLFVRARNVALSVPILKRKANPQREAFARVVLTLRDELNGFNSRWATGSTRT
ncbi:hypothetical protein MSAN_02356900 [Mycena sanguinolenta]|uniref:Uncharacterized protein n=1 Tax=Mycena sanguinolenta TaxID=230812 RepID=A0A8H6X621_9AGAR|nr:hypothetical protein MSAN_02356900 [Mycena sanguinolenta]